MTTFTIKKDNLAQNGAPEGKFYFRNYLDVLIESTFFQVARYIRESKIFGSVATTWDTWNPIKEDKP